MARMASVSVPGNVSDETIPPGKCEKMPFGGVNIDNVDVQACGLDGVEISGQESGSRPGRVVSWSKMVLPAIVFSQFAGTTLWFMPNAILSQLDFGENALSLLTTLVQAGFIVGTFLFTMLTISDRFSPPLVFLVMCMMGAMFNLLCITTNSLVLWSFLRALVGVCLAGVYPVGMKIAAGYYTNGLGARLGILVGALTLGTAFPWFLQGLHTNMRYQQTLIGVSCLAVFGGVFMPVVMLPPGRKLQTLKRFWKPMHVHSNEHRYWNAFRAIWSNQQFRASVVGYWGHNWELYTFWTYVPLLVQGNEVAQGWAVLNNALTTFLAIAIGFFSCTLGGLLSLKVGQDNIPGSAVVALVSLVSSFVCCLLAPLYKQMHPVVFFIYILFWGAVVISDSPQFSALCAKFAPVELVGSALMFSTCIGYIVTIICIQLVGVAIRSGIDPGLSMLCIVAPGPFIGIFRVYWQWPLHKAFLTRKRFVNSV